MTSGGEDGYDAEAVGEANPAVLARRQADVVLRRLLASSNGIAWNFYGNALPAIIGAAIIALVPLNRAAEHKLASVGVGKPAEEGK